MKKTEREEALDRDLHDVAMHISTLRRYMLHHLNADISVNPNDFWEQIFERLEKAVVATDIVEFFPTETEGCPDYLVNRS